MRDAAHVPVLLDEALEFLDSGRAGTYIDATLGLGGHALALLERNPRARLIGLDKDGLALEAVREKFVSYAERVRIYQADYKSLFDLDLSFADVRGVLFDLGMSSFQLDSPERGFSYSLEGPLDMRMDLRSRFTAARIVEEFSEARLAELFQEYGELHQARPLAREIVRRRKIRKFETTSDLRILIEEVTRWHPQPGKLHPAAKVFQALRIEVNQELVGLPEFFRELVREVRPSTRIVAISFHSLEDRIVKHTFIELASARIAVPLVRVLTHKPVTPTEEETARNSRARSAKLRAAERV
jgi:16S rRNA (cytosine1402-N4)-methyltransferase